MTEMWPFKQHKLPRAIQVTPAGVLRWGPLTFEECARIGIEAFMGPVSEIHEDCTRHYWCTPFRQDLARVVIFYYVNEAPNNVQDDFIDAIQYRITGKTPEGMPLMDTDPMLETTLHPMSDGRVLVNKAGLRPLYKPVIVVPRSVGPIPEDRTPGPPGFVIFRRSGTWEVNRIILLENESKLAQVASLPPL